MIINGIEVGPGVILEDVDLSGANLEGVDLSRSRLVNVNLEGANLRNATLGRWRKWTRSMTREERNQYRKERFINVNLSGADLTGAKLNDQLFFSCVLTDVRFDESYIWKTWFEGCEINKASFVNTQIAWTSFIYSNLNETDFSMAGFENLREMSTETTEDVELEKKLEIGDFFPSPHPKVVLDNDGECITIKIEKSIMHNSTFKGANFALVLFMVDATGSNFSLAKGAILEPTLVDFSHADFSDSPNFDLYPSYFKADFADIARSEYNSKFDDAIEAFGDTFEVDYQEYVPFFTSSQKERLRDMWSRINDMPNNEQLEYVVDRQTGGPNYPKMDQDFNGLITEIANYLSTHSANPFKFSDTNFSNANMSNWDLRNADLSSCKLEGANLQGANLSGCTLSNQLSPERILKMLGIRRQAQANQT